MQVQLCAPSSGPISSNTCYHMTVGTSTWLSPRKGVLFYNSFSGRHGTMTANRGARQIARAPPPARLVAAPTPPTPDLGRPPSLTSKDARWDIQTRSQPGHVGPGGRSGRSRVAKKAAGQFICYIKSSVVTWVASSVQQQAAWCNR